MEEAYRRIGVWAYGRRSRESAFTVTKPTPSIAYFSGRTVHGERRQGFVARAEM
jgi:hypothetical protein